MADPIESEPLDKDSATSAAVLPPLSDTSCLVNPPTDINDWLGRPLMATSTLVPRQLEALRRHPNDPRQHVDWGLLVATFGAGRRRAWWPIYTRGHQALTVAGLDPYLLREAPGPRPRRRRRRHGRRAAHRLPAAGATSPSGSTSAPPRCSAAVLVVGRSSNGAQAWFDVGGVPAAAVGVRQGHADPDAGLATSAPTCERPTAGCRSTASWSPCC